MSLTTYFESPKSYWFRWIAVLPIALIAYIITSPIIKILGDLTLLINQSLVSEEWMKKYFYAFIAGLFSGQVYIITAAYIAPIYKKETALVLLILAVLTIGAVMMTGYVNEEYNPWAENIGILIGLIIRYLMIDEEEKERLQRNKRA